MDVQAYKAREAYIARANATGATSAVWHVGNATASDDVMVHREGDTLVISFADGRIVRKGVDGIKTSQKIEGVPMRIEFGDGSSIVVPDGEKALKISPGFSALQTWFERWFLMMLPAMLVLAYGVIYVTIESIVPRIARAVVPIINVESINRIGDGVFESIFNFVEIDSVETDDLEAVRKFSELGSVLAEIEGGGYDYRFLIDVSRRWHYNAFAIPNGHIIMTKELFNALEEDEVAAVIAHEIAHVTQRHGMQALIRSSAWFAFSVMMFGAAPVLGYVPILAELTYSQEQELEADCIAAEILERAGYPPISVADALARLAELHGQDVLVPEDENVISSMFRTHPPISERVDHASQCAGLEGWHAR